MVKQKALSNKDEEPPDRGKVSTRTQTTRSFSKSPIRPIKTSLTKAPSPKPLSKSRISKFSFEEFLKKPDSKNSKESTLKTKSLKSIRSSRDLSIGDISDPLDEPLEMIKNAKKTKAFLSNKQKDKVEKMNCDSPSTSSTNVSNEQDQMGENKARAKKYVNNPAAGITLEVFSDNNSGKKDNSVKTIVINECQGAVSKLSENKDPVTSKEGDISVIPIKTSPISDSTPETTTFRARVDSIEDTTAAKPASVNIESDINRNIAKIRAETNNSEGTQAHNVEGRGTDNGISGTGQYSVQMNPLVELNSPVGKEQEQDGNSSKMDTSTTSTKSGNSKTPSPRSKTPKLDALDMGTNNQEIVNPIRAIHQSGFDTLPSSSSGSSSAGGGPAFATALPEIPTREEQNMGPEDQGNSSEEDNMSTQEEEVTDREEINQAEEIIQEFVTIIQLQENDRHILKCPIELYEQMDKSALKNMELKSIRTNFPRGLIAITTNTEAEARRILDMTQLGDISVNCRWAKDSSSNCGVIGTIPCPNVKETMERKIEVYKEALRQSGNPVKSIEWIKKKVWKRGVRGHTTQTTGYLKLEFINEIPNEVFLGRVKYEVENYIAETTQCWQCQKLGHIAANCKSTIPVCVFCGTKGHRKRDNRCGNRRVRCANCGKGHPASYRGCVEFLREKEAQKIKAKEKTPIHNARILASNKEFPHLQERETQPAATNGNPNQNHNRGYADAAAHRNSPRQDNQRQAPTDTQPQPQRTNGESNQRSAQVQEQTPQPQRTNGESNQRSAQTQEQTPQNCHKCNCNSNESKIAKQITKAMNKTVAKLLIGIAEILVQVYKMEKNTDKLSEEEKLCKFGDQLQIGLTNLLLSDSESSDAEEDSEEDQEESSEDEAEATSSPQQEAGGATASRNNTRKKKVKKKKKKKRKSWQR